MLDTNALVYWLHGGSPFHRAVAALIRAAMERGVRLYVLASSLNDVYYALRRHYMSEPAARASIQDAADMLELVALTAELVKASIASDEPDYEDGLIRAAAEALRVDAIVTYDAKAFASSRVRHLTADEALSLLSSEGVELG